jgi:Domain of unknown function (DUF5615)
MPTMNEASFLEKRSGHRYDVEVPADAGLTGSTDQMHLAHAIRDRRAVLTRNFGDFSDLHDVVVSAAAQAQDSTS